jgi:hypothetical protein
MRRLSSIRALQWLVERCGECGQDKHAQFANKIRLGGAAHARNTVLDKSRGHTWRYFYDQYDEGRLQDFYLQ